MEKTMLEHPDVYVGFPTPLALVTTADKEGKGNILTIAWAGIVSSEPAMASISMRRGKLSYHLIKAGGDFVINVPTADLVKATDYCGSVSGKNVDKWADAHLTPVPASKVKAPLIAECPINLECVIRHTLNLGSHDCFISEIVAIHADAAILKDGKLIGPSVHPLVYFGRDYWALGSERLAGKGVGMPKP